MRTGTPQLRKTRRGWAVRLDELPDLLTIDEAADWLGCSVATVRRLVKSGELRRVKVGRLDRIPRKALERLQEER
jgi:excisionase family DNA binding protein